MKTKSWGIALLLLVLLFTYGFAVSADTKQVHGEEETMNELQLLITAMKKTGASPERVQLHYGSMQPTIYQSVKEVKEAAGQIAQRAGLVQESEQADEVSYHSTKQGVYVELHAVALPQAKAGYASYLTVKMTAESRGLFSLKQQLSGVYKALNIDKILPHFNSCVEGIYSGTLKDDVQLDKLHQLFGFLGATVVEQAEDPTVKSLSAYTSQIPTYIFTNGKEMNVQAGIHVDRFGDRTRLTIGTPIITMEY
jgi:hypothetical protein